MSAQSSGGDPLEFMRNMWSSMGFALPGMVTPTLDVSELDKRIAEMKAVEGWLKMNLSMLQLSIQGLEMQRVTLAAMNSLSQPSEPPAAPNPFAAPQGFNPSGVWPWNLMPQGGGEAAPGTGSPADKPETPKK